MRGEGKTGKEREIHIRREEINESSVKDIRWKRRRLQRKKCEKSKLMEEDQDDKIRND